MTRIERGHFGQALPHHALLVRDGVGHRDVDDHEVVASFARLGGKPELAQAKALDGMRAGCDAQVRAPLEGLDGDDRAEHGLPRGDLHLRRKVGALAGEGRVFERVDVDEQVAGAGYPHGLSLSAAGRNVRIVFQRAFHHTGPAAGCAAGDASACVTAPRARRLMPQPDVAMAAVE